LANILHLKKIAQVPQMFYGKITKQYMQKSTIHISPETATIFIIQMFILIFNIFCVQLFYTPAYSV